MRALFLEDGNIICENWHLNAGMLWLLLSKREWNYQKQNV